MKARSLFYLAVMVLALITTGCRAAAVTVTPIKSFTVGLITNNPNGLRNIAGFREGLAAHGYHEGDNVTYVFSGDFTPTADLHDALNAMVAAGVDLIFTAGTPTGQAAYEVVSEDTGIPVVFGVIADPIAAGVLTNLSEPGGSMTGVRLVDNQSRRLQWLTQLAPGAQTVLVMYNPDDAAPTSALAQVEASSATLGLNLVVRETPDADAVRAVLADLPPTVDAIFLLPDSVTSASIAEVVAAADEHGLIVSGPSVIQVEQGALFTYGFVHTDVGRQAARIADMILRGADPGMIPVEAAEFHLALNLEAAESVGLELSDAVLRQAEVIIRSEEG